MTTLIQVQKSTTLAKIETARATDPVCSSTDDVRCVESFVPLLQRAPIKRNRISAKRGGFKKAKGPLTEAGCTFEHELAPTTIAVTLDRPEEDWVLRMCGFAVVESVGGDPKTVTYTPQSTTVDYASIEHVDHDTGADGRCYVFRGCVGDWVVKDSAKDRSMISVTAMAQTVEETTLDAAEAANGGPATPFAPGCAPVLEDDGPGGWTVSIQELEGDTYYDVTGPDGLLMLSAEVSGGSGAKEHEGMNGTGGRGRVGLDHTGEITATFEIEQCPGWHPQEHQADQTPYLITWSKPDPASPGNYMSRRFYGGIDSIARNEGTGRKTWTLSMYGMYPPGGGGEPAGRCPADDIFTMTYGTKS